MPDAARVMEGLRDTGYDFNTAIADIVDNSIAADATRVNINIAVSPTMEVSVFVADNGCGMDQDELQNAMFPSPLFPFCLRLRGFEAKTKISG